MKYKFLMVFMLTLVAAGVTHAQNWSVIDEHSFGYMSIEETVILENALVINASPNTTIPLSIQMDDNPKVDVIYHCHNQSIKVEGNKIINFTWDRCNLAVTWKEFGNWKTTITIADNNTIKTTNLNGTNTNSTWGNLWGNLTRFNITTSNNLLVLPQGCELRKAHNDTHIGSKANITNSTGWMLICIFRDKDGFEFGFTHWYNEPLNLTLNDITVFEFTTISTAGVERIFDIGEATKEKFDNATAGMEKIIKQTGLLMTEQKHRTCNQMLKMAMLEETTMEKFREVIEFPEYIDSCKNEHISEGLLIDLGNGKYVTEGKKQAIDLNYAIITGVCVIVAFIFLGLGIMKWVLRMI